MSKRTPLYDMHTALGAKMMDFYGWDMPLHYGSQIEEHHQVRNAAGMFDVSHMTVVDLTGQKVREYLKYLLANNVDRLKESGKALYSCMLNNQGGVIDDLIVYYMDEEWFRVVVNAGTHDRVMTWLENQAEPFGVKIAERTDLAMIAAQGPQVREMTHTVLGDAAKGLEDMAQFFSRTVNGIFVARTGYTGEDGYEILVPGEQAPELWNKLIEQGVKPCGLGARDTLRLEAGMNLYGSDMDESTTPLSAGLSWTVAWEPEERNFVGRQALEIQRKEGIKQKLVGLLLQEKGVLRNHVKVFINGLESGEVTSGSFSPTLGKAIGLARVSRGIGDSCTVEIRGNQIPASVVKPPFVRFGKVYV